MPRLVRRAPLSERIKAYLDPYDFLLSLSETLNDDTYEEWLKIWATPIGIGLNILFILARGASRTSTKGGDDVFGEDGSSSGWFAWLCAFQVHSLTLLCCLNAFYTFFRSRHYRLFEQPVDLPPATPSAHRVKVDSSPASSSPLRYLQNVIALSTATSRAYPDAEREVWELSVWDPRPLNLTIFTLFSPGHLLIYYLLLPTAALDPRPSVTVMQAIAFSVLLSIQLGMLKSSFSQQSKDTSLVHGEVMNEYDTKFVRPFLNRPVRDVGIQTRESATSPRGTRTREVDIYTPTTIVKRGFRTNPNPNYARQYDPDNLAAQPSELRRTSSHGTPTVDTPTHVNGYVNARTQSRPRLTRSPVKGDGGNMGVYSHAASPLRKAVSSNQLGLGRDSGEQRIASALKKRVSTPYGSSAINNTTRRESGRF
ncbi:hypothetical protein DOTSEDRAFT_130399 [Dothistroma septosporum NZE10]|uniref:Nuclear rim protein 1 n=1 Tax=Dothistroma septosporum (strain NZE10 / CBS 128990) TaxID=675120 RepID=N1PNC2_DOTSN|nr:hypothetical protein DOTSEDRAFT_130399 [Dothistroma septosporum NZE10]